MESARERYYWYKSHGICPMCGQEDAAKGKTYCLNCLDKHAASAMKYKAKHDTTEKNRVFCMERYYKAKESGICVRCFQNKQREGRVICQKCFSKLRRF